MFEEIENLKIVTVIHRASRPATKVDSRKLHGIVFRHKGSVRFHFEDNSLDVAEGNVIFVPKGARYTTEVLQDAAYTSINFEGNFSKKIKPRVFSIRHFSEYENLDLHFARMWNFGTPSEKHLCRSVFYHLLSYLCMQEREGDEEKNKLRQIEPALEYLKEHLFDCDLKISHLHHLCGISDTYLRKIFMEAFGTTPKNYVTSKRLLHARTLLLFGELDSVAEVAFSVGFSDPLYFSKAFKKEFDISPSKLIRE